MADSISKNTVSEEKTQYMNSIRHNMAILALLRRQTPYLEGHKTLNMGKRLLYF